MIEANIVEIDPTVVNDMSSEEEVAIETLEDSKKRFSKRDRLKAELMRRFQHVAGVPADTTLIHLANTNGIRNNPITKRDILIAHEMLERSKYAAKGKMNRRQPSAVDIHQQTVEVPHVIKEYYSDVELSADVMHLNNIPFVTSISAHIHYGTTGAIDNMTCPKLENELKNIIRSYTARSFRVVLILVGIQFKALKDRNAVDAAFNVVARGEHVTKIKRFYKVIKERCRCYYAMIHFQSLPRIMIVHLMMTVMFYINAFVWMKGVS